MLTKRYETSDGVFYYIGEKDAGLGAGLCITAYEGDARTLMLPDRIDSYPVKTVGKKAFLGNRHINHIIFPSTIETVGDWALLGCHELQKITLPKKEIAFGRQVFQKAQRLYEVCIAGNEKETDRLLACAVTMLEAEYLLTPLLVGSDSWYRNLDARIMTVLKESEESALKNLVYCAEEDMADKQAICLKELAKKKADIAFLRLCYSDNMADDVRHTLMQYLLQRTKGRGDESAWEAVKERRHEQLMYCDILYEAGGICEENINAALDDLGEDNVELKAYLLNKRQRRQQTHSLWDALKWE
ncbi:MAG: leucine-rich repeat domain-containing protein [Clostridium sp.]|nr:leucine-rich repeat domain-containing protein [Clostridium sp.]